MEQTRAVASGQTGPAALHPRVPSRPQAAERPADDAARGEHVHSEPAPPPPATPPAAAGGGAAPKLPRRHSVRAQVLTALREALISGELAVGEVYS
ncbi:MAG: hypothetical protein ACRDOV_14910, partial [Streptomyces sp.]